MSLGEVVDGDVVLSVYGRLADAFWRRIPVYFPHVRLDTFVIMPNHIHGIIWIVEDVGGRGKTASRNGRGEATSQLSGDTNPSSGSNGWGIQDHAMVASPLRMPDAAPPPPRLSRRRRSRPNGVQSGSLGAIIGNFKSVVTRRVNRLRGTPGAPFWQRNYYEHIIRDDRSLRAIRRYIRDNPLCWERDRLNPSTS